MDIFADLEATLDEVAEANPRVEAEQTDSTKTVADLKALLEVSMTTNSSLVLDDILQNEGRIDMIKIDIEGHEPRALRGMIETVRKHRPVIFSEFNPDGIRELSDIEPGEYFQMLQGEGYSISVIELDGNELPMKDEAAIMDYWTRFHSTHDESYGNIDIIARPVSAP